MAKVVKHLKLPKKPEAQEEHDALPIDDSAEAEARELIEALSKMTPNLMGTAHGLALIHAAQRWMAQYVEKP